MAANEPNPHMPFDFSLPLYNIYKETFELDYKYSNGILLNNQSLIKILGGVDTGVGSGVEPKR